MTISLHRALLALLATALLVALVPAGLLLERRLVGELEARARDDLARAPMILEDRSAARSDAMRMHAEALAETGGLAGALARGDRTNAVGLVVSAASFPGEEPLLVAGDGEAWLGPPAAAEAVPADGSSEPRVTYVFHGGVPVAVALAPVTEGGSWRGAAGVAAAMDQVVASTLAGLTRSEVTILGPAGEVAASTATPPLPPEVADSARSWQEGEGVHEVALGDDRLWVAAAPLGDVGTVLFTRRASQELAILPQLRRGALLAGLLALGLALLVGALVSVTLTRPVRTLARASERLAEGDFEAPLKSSRIREIDRVSRAFDQMRRALEARLEELEDRQRRLTALQTELIQRDRLVASGRLVAELAHEIRNPVANVRNCLEVASRRLADDPETREFVTMAVDELLRMHGLAEQMLDLNRPADPDVVECDPVEVGRQVARLVRAGSGDEAWSLEVAGPEGIRARIPEDALKQVLLNLVENAREAMDGNGTIEVRIGSEDGTLEIRVEDEGPGIPDEDLSRLFDPFFTTKGEVSGVGLGLFVAEGIVRRYGGRLRAENREDGGARFRIELPRADGGATSGTAAGSAGAGDPADGETEP